MGLLDGKRLLVTHPELFEALSAWEQVLATGTSHTRLLLLHHQPAHPEAHTAIGCPLAWHSWLG